MKTFAVMAAFYAAIFLFLWLAGPPKVTGPSTGESCVELVERLWKTKRLQGLTAAEQADADMCHEALKPSNR